MITLNNEHLTVNIKESGAELTSIVDQATNYEFLWQADEAYWDRHAPVLFPIVGRLKDDQYHYQGHVYDMNQHGFARDALFEVVEATDTSALFKWTSNEETKKNYPFDFELWIAYKLLQNKVTTTYTVNNPSEREALYYSIGGHPGFNVSQTEDETGKLEFDQVSVHIHTDSELIEFPLSEDGLIKEKDAESVAVRDIPLSHETFKEDALVYNVPEGTTIELKDDANQVNIRVQSVDLPYLGIWSPAPARAPFVCIEPWAGFADTADASGDFTEKMGINHLEPSHESTHEFTMIFEKK